MQVAPGVPGAPTAPGPPTVAAVATVGDLDAAAIVGALGAAGDRPGRLGAAIALHAVVGSTMDLAAAWAAAGAPDGAVVLADVQAAGRGRHGRAWLAPPGTALLLSVVLRHDGPADRIGQLPMAVALGALEAVSRRLGPGAAAALKWPNDLVVGDAKLAGLLAEAAWPGGGPAGTVGPTVIVGLGLNVAAPAAALPPGATSLAQAGATDLDRSLLAADLLAAADRHLADLAAGADLVPRWSARLATLGRAVTVRDAATGAVVVRGRAESVAGDGALVVAADDGRRVAVRAGDVTLA